MTKFLLKAFVPCLVCFCTFSPRPVAEAAAA